mmetsp:Transcript_12109/g.15840  ORF Transcript_12109/g.15840 Transcript_12109/m.15840 type:complete len:275 (-) Transcript_12109:327-1151(-)|eukprot:CAMPEP_0117745068 /NCGR_PEP_ID=MMETSP0947-20121206/7136_1 /TAXON_ID=44440 /ORGANISM="Chattonella subsalsa, Strain CCMP2191" /LENGTH=274 /DNA_ID=CAMNT_0005562141 /DNA_START=68 /DNA_END=892 /DNA_ORIENTATION=-
MSFIGYIESHKLQLCNLIFFIINFVVTALNNGSTYGKSNEEVSAEYQTLITPAGWAFAIWGIIFTLETIFSVWQLFIAKDSFLLQGVSWWFVSANIFQTLWDFAFAQEMLVLSAILLGGIALSLAVLCTKLIYFKLSQKSEAQALYVDFSFLTFGLHGGWTAVAFLLNVNVAIVGAGFSANFQLWAAGITLGLATLTGLWFILAVKNMAYGLALSWAFFGVAWNQAQASALLGEETATILSQVSFTLSAFLLLTSVMALLPYDTSRILGKMKTS